MLPRRRELQYRCPQVTSETPLKPTPAPVGLSEPAPRGERFERRKEEILNAAGALFNEHGLKDATLAVVASHIGLNLKSLRYYYRRRDDLVAAAFERSIGRLRTLVENAVAAPTFEARLRAFVRSYFELQARIAQKEEPELVYFGDLRALTGPNLRAVIDDYVALYRLVCGIFDDVTPAWNAKQVNAHAHLLISQLHWSVVWIGDYVPEDYGRAAEKLCDILLNGIAADIDVLDIESVDMPTPFGVSDRLSQESFLRAATTLINDIGYRGASVDRISAMLKVTKGSFYHHNETRDALVVACFQRTFSIIRAAQDLALAKQEKGLSQAASAAVSLISRQMSPEGVLLRTSALAAIGPDLRRKMSRKMSLLTWRFADMLNDGLVDGSVRLCDMRIASEAMTAAINAAQELQRWVPSADIENAATLYLRPLLLGLSRMGREAAQRE